MMLYIGQFVFWEQVWCGTITRHEGQIISKYCTGRNHWFAVVRTEKGEKKIAVNRLTPLDTSL